jgi:hypothetical protein
MVLDLVNLVFDKVYTSWIVDIVIRSVDLSAFSNGFCGIVNVGR